MNRNSITTDRSSFDQYLESIGRVPLMTPEEEIRCGKLVQRMNELKALERKLTPREEREVRNGERAKNRFVKANLRLVVYVVKQHQSRTQFLDMMDLIQEASIGLMRAAEMYDPIRGYKFSTYAYWWIRQAVSRCIMQQDRAIRRPASVAELASKLGKLRQSETHRLGRAPTLTELAEAAGVARIDLELLAERGGHCMSLDQPVGGEDSTSCLSDFIPDRSCDDTDTLGLDLSLNKALIESSLQKLSETERSFLVMRYGLDGDGPSTFVDIAKAAGVSRERVRQITNRAIKKLKFHLAHPHQQLVNPTNERVDVRTKVVAPPRRMLRDGVFYGYEARPSQQEGRPAQAPKYAPLLS